MNPKLKPKPRTNQNLEFGIGIKIHGLVKARVITITKTSPKLI
jgi:hypothetical protein